VASGAAGRANAGLCPASSFFDDDSVRKAHQVNLQLTAERRHLHHFSLRCTHFAAVVYLCYVLLPTIETNLFISVWSSCTEFGLHTDRAVG